MRSRPVGIIVVALTAAACGSPVGPEPGDVHTPNAEVDAISGLIELPPLEGETESAPSGVNSSGLVVGASGEQAVVWRDGVPEALEMPEGAAGRAEHVNDADLIVGSVRIDGLWRAVRWEQGRMIEVGTLPGHVESDVTGLSEAGHVSGISYSEGHLEPTWTAGNRGFVWYEGEMTSLPPLPDHDVTRAFAVNSAGVVFGESVNSLAEAPRFVMWQDGEIIWAQESGDPHAWYFLAVGITDAGDAFVRTDTEDEVWRWRDGEFSYYPFDGYDPPRWAWDVTPGGLILGEIAGEQGVWKSDDFIPFDATLASACGIISDGGYVVCEGPNATYPFLTTLATLTTQAAGQRPVRTAKVTDLTVSEVTASTVSLRWTQVDDGTGHPASYRLKYASAPIEDWKSATIGCERTIKGSETGAEISCVAEGLKPGTHLDFQLMSFRTEHGKWVGARYSNIASTRTLAAAAGEPAPERRATGPPPWSAMTAAR